MGFAAQDIRVLFNIPPPPAMKQLPRGALSDFVAADGVLHSTPYQ
jgi:hypothetical protein